jgi:hypothetical protein
MKNKIRYSALILALSLVILVSGCAQQEYNVEITDITAARVEPVEIRTTAAIVTVNAEIADTAEKLQRGLMFRTSMGENEGMLFVFNDEQPRTFWMKDTLIPLDIIFISSAGEVVDIKKNFVPCAAEPCPSYTSKQSARYVLEVNAGFADMYAVENGLTVKLPQV